MVERQGPAMRWLQIGSNRVETGGFAAKLPHLIDPGAAVADSSTSDRLPDGSAVQVLRAIGVVQDWSEAHRSRRIPRGSSGELLGGSAVSRPL